MKIEIFNDSIEKFIQSLEKDWIPLNNNNVYVILKI